MEFPAPNIRQYADLHTSPEPPLLAELRRETHLKVLYPQMLSGHGVGRFLAFISRLVRPSRILEIGTYTGYSAICLAEGLQPGGKMISLERNEELGDFHQRYFAQANLLDKIDVRYGAALETLPSVEGPLDLVFMDADKANYPSYFELVMPKLRPGGLLIADNVLWSGKVLDKQINDKETSGIRAFNQLVSESQETYFQLLPIRDGLMFVQKQ